MNPNFDSKILRNNTSDEDSLPKRPRAPKKKPGFDADTLRNNLTAEMEPLLVTPEHAAELIGFSVAWLAAAREGRKDHKGPPFVKVGDSQTSPIRYRMRDLRAWVDSLETQTSTMHRVVVRASSFDEWLSNTDDMPWLFFVNLQGSEAIQVFAGLSQLDSFTSYNLKWLPRENYRAGFYSKRKLTLGIIEHLNHSLI